MKEVAQNKPKRSRAKKPPPVEITPEEETAPEDFLPEIKPEFLKEVLQRVPSLKTRDDNGHVIRRGRNLSGNVPFRRKYYYFDLKVMEHPGWGATIEKAPNQVKGLIKCMVDEGITSPDTAEIGGDICGIAINKGYVDSKIDPPKLFAYYRRAMETLGLREA